MKLGRFIDWFVRNIKGNWRLPANIEPVQVLFRMKWGQISQFEVRQPGLLHWDVELVVIVAVLRRPGCLAAGLRAGAVGISQGQPQPPQLWRDNSLAVREVRQEAVTEVGVGDVLPLSFLKEGKLPVRIKHLKGIFLLFRERLSVSDVEGFTQSFQIKLAGLKTLVGDS